MGEGEVSHRGGSRVAGVGEDIALTLLVVSAVREADFVEGGECICSGQE